MPRKPNARTFGQDLMHGEHPGIRPGRKRTRRDAVPGGSGGPNSAHRRFSDQHLARQQARQAGLVPAGLAFGQFNMTDGATRTISGTSITDPVLCELALRWFCPPGGVVWNPFMGESSIGIVASRLGYRYTAVDVRAEQVAANKAQSNVICPPDKYPPPRWLVGDGRTADPEECCRGAPDFVLSCPPYWGLELYSDLPQDLSTMDYPEFLAAYRESIARACEALKPDRFACFIVGEVRHPDTGNYVGFVPDTIRAFTDAGMGFYNEAILVTACGSLPVRTRKQFEASRKLGRTHQSVLFFVKGDARRATAAVGAVDFGEPDDGGDAAGQVDESNALSINANAESVEPTRVDVPTRWRVSAAWAAKAHECTAAGIAARCHGNCCRTMAFWPPNSATAPGATGCPKLGPDGCTFAQADKPVTCLLYPFVVNKSGTIVLHQRATFAKGVCCGNYGNGPPLIDAARGGLVELFGEEQYARVRADVLGGRDGFFDVPPAVAAAWVRERELAAMKAPPQPRSDVPAPAGA